MKISIKNILKDSIKNIKKHKNNIIIIFLIILIVCWIIYLVYYKINDTFETSTTKFIPTQNPTLTKTSTTQTLIYSYTPTGFTWTPPFFITDATFTVVGGNGSEGAGGATNTIGLGGLGASITMTLHVSSDQTYSIYPGNNGYTFISKNSYLCGISSIPNPNVSGATLGNGGTPDNQVIDGYYGICGGGSASALYLNSNPLIVAGGGGGGGAVGDGENSSNVMILTNAKSNIITDGTPHGDIASMVGGSGGGAPGGTLPPGIYAIGKGFSPGHGWNYYLGGHAGTSLVPNSSYIKDFAPNPHPPSDAQGYLAILSDYPDKEYVASITSILNRPNNSPNNDLPYISITTFAYTLLLPKNPMDLFPNYVISTNPINNNTYTNIVLYVPNIIVNSGDIIYLPVYFSNSNRTPHAIILIYLNIITTPTQFSSSVIVTDNPFNCVYIEKSIYQDRLFIETTSPIQYPDFGIMLLCYLKLTIAENIVNKNLQEFKMCLIVSCIINNNINYATLRNDIRPPTGIYSQDKFYVSASWYRDGIDNHSYPINTFPPLCISQSIIDCINNNNIPGHDTFNIKDNIILEIINNTDTICTPKTTQSQLNTQTVTPSQPSSPTPPPTITHQPTTTTKSSAYYSETDGQSYYKQLSDFNDYILKNQNNLVNILATIQNAKEETKSNNKVLTNSITNLYNKQYLEFTNKINAVVNNKYNKSKSVK